MATRKNKKMNKKLICGMVVLFIIVAAGVTGGLMWNQARNNDNGPKPEVPNVEERKDNDIEEPTEGEELTSTGVEKEAIVQYDGENPNEAEDLSGVVTYAGVVDDRLMIRLNIDQYLDSGECELTLSRDGATIYTSIANIVGGPATATCEGFDVPVSELGGGNLQININLSAGERRGSVRGEVNI